MDRKPIVDFPQGIYIYIYYIRATTIGGKNNNNNKHLLGVVGELNAQQPAIKKEESRAGGSKAQSIP